jgi:hypothetical protein
MTVKGCDMRRCSGRPAGTARTSLGACLLAAVLLAACSSPVKDFDREGLLRFDNLEKGDAVQVRVTDQDKNELMPQNAEPGASLVRLRFKGVGGGALTIKVVVTHLDGTVCESVELTVKAEGSFELSFDLASRANCALPPDAGIPPDAQPDVQPDLQPDLQPDGSPDLGPSPECQQYCTVMRDRCPSVYETDPECLTTCQGFAWLAHDPRANDVTCRIATAKAAPKPDDEASCRAAGPSGGNFCGLLCRNLCEATAQVCPGALPGGSLESCLRAPCDPTKIGPIRSETGDTLDCRFHWLTVAARDKQSCAKLAPDGPCR